MRIRVDPRVSDLAATGLLLVGFLLVALAVSAAPSLLRSAMQRPGASAPQPPLSAPSARGASLS